MHRILEVIDRSEYPILFHCHKGADRTGMASAIALLCAPERPWKKRAQQLGFRFGHLPFGRTVNIDRFFDLYQEWLTEHGLAHSPALFRRWIEEELLSRRMPLPAGTSWTDRATASTQ